MALVHSHCCWAVTTGPHLQNPSIFPNRNSVPFPSRLPLSPRPGPWQPPILLSASINLTRLSPSCEWSQTLFVLSRLAISRNTAIRSARRHGLSDIHCVRRPRLASLSVCGHVGCVRVWSTVSDAAKNTVTRIRPRDPPFDPFGCIPRSRIAGSSKNGYFLIWRGTTLWLSTLGLPF